MTVRTALREGAEFLAGLGVPGARLDVEVLLCRVLGCGREKLYVAFESILGAGAMKQFHSLLRRRAQREPISYITGHREFWSLDFDVTPQVLVPRPETELLVEVTLGILAKKGSPARILEIGTGSGAISVSLATERTDAEIWATDLSGSALEVARINARRHKVEKQIHFLQGDLFAPLGKRGFGFFGLVVSNPPYVPSAEIERLAREIHHWEPRLALDGGADGLDCYRRILGEAHRYLTEPGFLVLEIGAESGAQVSPLVEATGRFRAPAIHRDYCGRERVVVAQKAPFDAMYGRRNLIPSEAKTQRG
ncbi:MAG: peptide chain release factor N(5)-glutamine methyltransferase [Deltaproteobacteria bacterium]|nr:peptide chain release factor N(5)-glutamine methyltransferase [Deltaproteobacteria bacterium]